jgi:hypothetical protein
LAADITLIPPRCGERFGPSLSLSEPGWIQDPTGPTGRVVFKYTIHGTLNGNPVDLTASSPPIQMTG